VVANTITYRLEKGSALTYQELDDNFRYLDLTKGTGSGDGGATFDADKDTGMDPEVSEDEDVLRFFVGNSIPGYSNVQSVMTLAANGLIVNMGQSNQAGSTVNGAPIVLQAGSGANVVFHADTKGGDIELRPGNYNTYANTDSANTSTPSTEGVVRVIGPNVDGPGVARFFDTDRNEFVGISGPDNLDTSYTIKLPNVLGTVGQALILQNASGNTEWGAGGGGASPATNAFTTFTVSGQSTLYAANGDSTLAFVGSNGINISTAPSSNTITFELGSIVFPSQNVFASIAVAGQDSVVADAVNDTLTFVAGSNMTITTEEGTDTITFTSTATSPESNTFSTFAVSGQDSVVAETDDDTLTFVAGSNMTITTDASTDTITFAASVVASESNTFSTIAVSGQDSVVAETDDDTLTFVAGSNMTITTDAATDTITFTATGGGGGGTGDISANGTTSYAYAANTEVSIWTSNNQIMGTPAFKFDYGANTLTVIGHIQATTKSFLIKHPTKEHHMLQYASLEGPENGVYVRGKSSQNVIELPDYWINLIDEETITVELTPNGFYQELFVKEINNNRIHVGNNKSDSLRYFYHVYAERKDVPKLETEYEVALKWL